MQEINSILNQIQNSSTMHDVLNLKASIVGKNGILTQEFKKMGSLSPEERTKKGQELNEAKTRVELQVETKLKQIKIDEINNSLSNEKIDITTPSTNAEYGSIHPVSFVIQEVEEFFFKHGFSIQDGPEIEDDFHNFEALNFPELHPARNMHDTFYLENSKNLLRTHTSSVQIRHMKNNKPPFRFIAHGRTYRCESDRTHIPMFHQLEGVCIDKNITFAHLKTITEDFLRHFFSNDKMEIRFRSSFFPFTEPSCEVDINMGSGYLEVMGAGMVHQNVLKQCEIDTNTYQGFAFGMGIERLAMLKYGIKDVRDCISSTQSWRKHYGFNQF
jgi:phenylalanyl-tRNA synthetase alpha chain